MAVWCPRPQLPGCCGSRPHRDEGCTGQEVGAQALHSHQLPVGPKAPPLQACFPICAVGAEGIGPLLTRQAGKRPAPGPRSLPHCVVPRRRPRADTGVSQAQCASWSWRSEHPEGLPGGGDACPRPPGSWNPEPRWGRESPWREGPLQCGTEAVVPGGRSGHGPLGAAAPRGES